MISQLLKGSSNGTVVELFRYVFVGGFAFIIDYGTLFLLTEFAGINYLLSAAIAFVSGLVMNYMLSIIWVFSNSRLGNRMTEFVIFASIGIIGLLLNEVIMYLCSDVLSIYYMVSKLCSTGIVFFWNFFGRKLLLFNKTI